VTRKARLNHSTPTPSLTLRDIRRDRFGALRRRWHLDAPFNERVKPQINIGLHERTAPLKPRFFTQPAALQKYPPTLEPG
jgi:hypothetical protein